MTATLIAPSGMPGVALACLLQDCRAPGGTGSRGHYQDHVSSPHAM